MAEEIDAVYTWVDGRGAGFQAAYRRYAGALEMAPVNRYRDNGELRCSLRSLLRHAPWVRRVHILTDGTLPRWLDPSHPRIHPVTHAEVFPDPDCLPTFNSHAIEMCLHRIPGITRRFLYFNDDMFLRRDVRPQDFLTPAGGQYSFADNSPLHAFEDRGAARDRACAYTQRLLNERWGTPASPRLLPSHAPRLYDREILRLLEREFARECRETAGHRFRAATDVAMDVLYGYSLLESPALRGPHCLCVLPERSPQYRFSMIEKRYLRTFHHYARILWERPRFLCINDDLEGVPDYHPLVLSLRAFLRVCSLRRAPWERRPWGRGASVA